MGVLDTQKFGTGRLVSRTQFRFNGTISAEPLSNGSCKYLDGLAFLLILYLRLTRKLLHL
jgi:hypothetical protein